MKTPLTSDVTRRHVVDLDVLVASTPSIDGVWRSGVEWGDRVFVFTMNSVYLMMFVGDDTFVVSGGWFDHRGASPAEMSVTGCSWGGSVINRRLIAAPGLHLEFGNGVVTTRIRRVVFARNLDTGAPH